jgi:hypothetical protein
MLQLYDLQLANDSQGLSVLFTAFFASSPNDYITITRLPSKRATPLTVFRLLLSAVEAGPARMPEILDYRIDWGSLLRIGGA